MPRKLRLEYPGARYHVMSRGDRREKIFLDDVDRQDFVKTLAEACQKTNWQVPGYGLMPNPYHVVLETPVPNLVAGMAWLQSTYTIRLNHRHQLLGHVLSGRYTAQFRSKAVATAICGARAITCISTRCGQERFRLKSGCCRIRGGASARIWLRRSIGPAGFADELQRHGWEEADLLARRKNDPIKLDIAGRLKRERTLSTRAIAWRMHLGSSKAANRSLHCHLRGGGAASTGQGQLAL